MHLLTAVVLVVTSPCAHDKPSLCVKSQTRVRPHALVGTHGAHTLQTPEAGLCLSHRAAHAPSTSVRVPHLLTAPGEVQADSQKAGDRRSVATAALSSPGPCSSAECRLQRQCWRPMACDEPCARADRQTPAHPRAPCPDRQRTACPRMWPGATSLQQGGPLRTCFSTFRGSSPWPEGPQQSLTTRQGCRPPHRASSAHHSRSPPDPRVNVWRGGEGP